MKIKNLINSVPANIADTHINRIIADSRQCQKGDLYVAITCDEVLSHINDAIHAGAVAVVIEEDILRRYGGVLPKCQYIPVTNSRAALSYLAKQFYKNQPEFIAAVTGTNGKSSVASFIRQICSCLGLRSASFGTLGLELGDNIHLTNSIDYPKLTTPDSLSMHKMLAELQENNITHFSFEASSHGLDQYRLHDVTLISAGFTNLTQDHLDYHGTMEAYFASKTRLFTEILQPGGTAVINIDSLYGKSLQLLLKPHDVKVITYGTNPNANLVAQNIKLQPNCLVFDLSFGNEYYKNISIEIAGSFQIENILCAIGQVMAFGFSLSEIVPTLSKLKSARGRMQLVGNVNNGAAIYVDYAHTPDALLRALQALRGHVVGSGRLVLVFGCGGNRDAGKRAIMGDIAENYADVVYVTDDNPRFEDPQYIRAQILSKCPKGIDCPDRFQAIQLAIKELKPNDVLLIAGKGHESGQLIRNEIIPFDDADVVAQILGS